MDKSKTSDFLKGANIDGFLVTSQINILYLTGFKGVSQTEREALLILRQPKNILITAKLYQLEAKKLASDNLEVKIASERNEYETFIKQSFGNLERLGFESTNLTHAEHKKFRKYFKGKFVPTEDLIEKLREIKSAVEIENITRAQFITQKAFEQVIKTIKIGQTETEIADKLISILKAKGSHGIAFEPIVASGPNSALPHHQTSQRKIKNGDTLLFDFGAKYKNYCADFSRTIFVGNPNNTQINTYNHVFVAQQKSIAKIKPGIKAKKIFNQANDYFKKLKLDQYFIHSLGHGIGLEVHEKPSLSAKSKDILTSGMVFSAEPGLYFDWGGVRIEDLVYIQNDKPKVIAKTSEFIKIKG